MKIKFIIVLLLIVITSKSICQATFKVYVQENRYDMSFSDKYRFYQFMGGYYIDRDKKGVINYKFVEQGIERLYPNNNDEGFLSIDLENKIYQDMKAGHKNDFHTKYAVLQFVQLVKFIKKKRPNVKVGVYGVPFRFNYESQKKYNDFDKLAPLLKAVDYISPSLYLSYSENQRGSSYVTEYIEENLSLFLDYAKRVNKPVIPYVWYRVHPSNKKFGSELISKERMDLYLNKIKYFEHDGKKVEGIIWWEPSNSLKMLETKNIYPNNFNSIEEVLREYTGGL